MLSKVHPTDDHILNLLVNSEELIGDYVNSYPGKNNVDLSLNWLDDWFKIRAK